MAIINSTLLAGWKDEAFLVCYTIFLSLFYVLICWKVIWKIPTLFVAITEKILKFLGMILEVSLDEYMRKDIYIQHSFGQKKHADATPDYMSINSITDYGLYDPKFKSFSSRDGITLNIKTPEPHENTGKDWFIKSGNSSKNNENYYPSSDSSVIYEYRACTDHALIKRINELTNSYFDREVYANDRKNALCSRFYFLSCFLPSRMSYSEWYQSSKFMEYGLKTILITCYIFTILVHYFGMDKVNYFLFSYGVVSLILAYSNQVLISNSYHAFKHWFTSFYMIGQIIYYDDQYFRIIAMDIERIYCCPAEIVNIDSWIQNYRPTDDLSVNARMNMTQTNKSTVLKSLAVLKIPHIEHRFMHKAIHCIPMVVKIRFDIIDV